MNRPLLKFGPIDPNAASGSIDENYSLRKVISTLRRRLEIIVSAIVVCVVASGLYVFTAKPKYQASALILIDPRQPRIFDDSGADTRIMLQENLIVDSEIEVAKSNEVLMRVAESEDIFGDPEFRESTIVRRAKDWLYGAIGLRDDQLDTNEKDVIFTEFKKRIKAGRVGVTFVVRISYSSVDPKRAADVTNAIAQGYLDDQLESRFAKAKHTSEWLRKRLAQIQEQLIEAERSVELYKEKHDIVGTKWSGGREGLVTDQQLSELNSRLIIARTESATAKARLNRIRKILNEGNSDAAVEDVLKSPEIQKLREELNNRSRFAGKIKQKYGPKHLSYKNAIGEIARIRAQILSELRRIAQSYESEYEISRSREYSLEQNLQRLKGAHIFAGQSQVKLRELERQAESIKDLYKGLLETLQKTNERETLPTVNARVIERARPPLDPNWPKKKLILALGLVFGGSLGVGLALLREAMDSYVWTQNDVESIMGVRCFGMIPKLQIRQPKQLRRFRGPTFAQPTINSLETAEKRLIDPNLVAPYRLPLTDRFGHVSEIMRHVLVSLRLAKSQGENRRPAVIAFVSTVPGEGKSTVGMLQSIYLAQNGSRTLLIDCDFRKQTLTKTLTPKHCLDVPGQQAAANKGLHQYIWQEKDSKLDFLPVFRAKQTDEGFDLVMKGEISQIIERVRDGYEFIVLDLPPLLVLPDARALSESVDHVIYVIEWGKVRKEAIAEALSHAPEISERLIGSILSKVDLNKIGKYGDYYYGEYYRYGEER